jgi:hypothetical protein
MKNYIKLILIAIILSIGSIPLNVDAKSKSTDSPCYEGEVGFLNGACCPDYEPILNHNYCYTQEEYDKVQNSDEGLRTAICSGMAVLGKPCAPGYAPGS